MAIDHTALKNRAFPEIVHAYGPKDCILYALGVGVGMDPADEGALGFTYEARLKALPTMAVVLGYPGFWLRDPDCGIDWKAVLHIHQEIVLHRALPTEGKVIGRTSIEEIFDKGPGKGALLVTRRDISDADTGVALATVKVTELCRTDGGFGGPPAPRTDRTPPPGRPPDAVVTLPSSHQAALIYRLSGDDNAFHVDLQIARSAGFERPILHGLSTFGMAGRGVLKALCADEPSRLRTLSVRFTAPVEPGDILRLELWREGVGYGRFRGFVDDGSRLVLDDGEVKFDPG